MATEAEILKRECAAMTRESAEEIRDDIKAGIEGQRDIIAPEQIGSPTDATAPLPYRVFAAKHRAGGKRPGVPRIQSGALLASILSAPVQDSMAKVFIGSDEQKAVIQQQGGNVRYAYSGDANKARFKSTRPRPFFGVSDIALELVEDVVAETGKRIEQQFAGADSFGTIKVIIQ